MTITNKSLPDNSNHHYMYWALYVNYISWYTDHISAMTESTDSWAWQFCLDLLTVPHAGIVWIDWLYNMSPKTKVLHTVPHVIYVLIYWQYHMSALSGSTDSTWLMRASFSWWLLLRSCSSWAFSSSRTCISRLSAVSAALLSWAAFDLCNSAISL